MIKSLLRYGFAAAGPVAVAGSQLILSLQLLHRLPPETFGTFSFLLVASQFSTGISNALLCAPLPVLLNNEDGDERDAIVRCMFAINGLYVLATLMFFLILCSQLGESFLETALFSAYAGTAVLRWFARAHAYAAAAPLRTTTSDLVYSLALLAGIGAIWALGGNSSAGPYAVLLVSALLGLVPFGRRFLAACVSQFTRADLDRYGQVWRRHSRWSLTGVVTTEMTGNAHAYIVTLVAGPASFAGVAASAILIRPITVVMNALTEFERPRMARALGSGQTDQVLRSALVFRLVLIAAWITTGLAAAAVLLWAPRLLFPGEYALAPITQGCALWIAVAGVRLARTPESTVLQAAGSFRPLAYASIISCLVTIPAVIALLVVGGPIGSIVGVLIGEAVFAGWIWRQTLVWRRSTRAE